MATIVQRCSWLENASHLEEEFVMAGGAVAAADNDRSKSCLYDHPENRIGWPWRLVHLVGNSAAFDFAVGKQSLSEQGWEFHNLLKVSSL